MSEAALVSAARRGKRSAFEELCQRSGQAVYRTVYRITKNREDAEDALQDAYLRAFLHLKDFDGRSNFSTWLTRIAINSALMLLRKRRAGREISMEGYSDGTETVAPLETPDRAPNPETRLALKQRHEKLRGAIDGLRPSIRKVIELQLSHDHSMKETAGMMGISVCAAKSRLFHAKAQLRKSLTSKTTSDASPRQQMQRLNGREMQYANDRGFEMSESQI
jgi:RNA polymerase sigma-70 factor (ECF subfamily)